MKTLVELNDELNTLLVKNTDKNISNKELKRINDIVNIVSQIKAKRQADLQKAIENEGRGALIFVHVGKCAGGTLWNALIQCSALQKQFQTIAKVHMRKPPILKYAKYIFVFRDPVERAISAFNWRYQQVVLTKGPRKRKSEEAKILEKYGSINNLGRKLYINGDINDAVFRELQEIKHMEKNFSFYFSELFDRISRENIYKKIDIEELSDYLKELSPQYNNITSTDRKHTIQLRWEETEKSTILALKKCFASDYETLKKYDEIC